MRSRVARPARTSTPDSPTTEEYVHHPLIDPRTLEGFWLESYLEAILNRATIIATGLPNGKAIRKVFAELLRFVLETRYQGCHDTSAALHMLLAESGIPSTLCIGEVSAGEAHFDHSWVQIHGFVFDVAVCMPGEGSAFVSAPVFGSIDLVSDRRTKLIYADRRAGSHDQAQRVLGAELANFPSTQRADGGLDVWSLAEKIALRLGSKRHSACVFQTKYGSLRRTRREEADKSSPVVHH